MARKGGSKHLKRMAAPRFWPIKTKEAQWTIQPRPGAHAKTESIPLTVILRDHLHSARTAREARLLLSQGKVRVDGRVRRDAKYPVGLMDVIEISGTEPAYRVTPVKGKIFSLIEAAGDARNFKVCKVSDKRTVTNGQLQVTLHDGRNILVKVQNPKTPTEDIYLTGSSLQIEIPSQKILKQMKMVEGAYAVVTAGRNLGRHGNICSVEAGAANRPGIVEIRDGKGEIFRTVSDYVFVVGEGTPMIELPGA